MKNIGLAIVALLAGVAAVGCAPPAVIHELGVTGAGQALSRITSEPLQEVRPAISPDGKTLLFEVFVPESAGHREERTIVGVDPNTGARRTLYTPNTSLAGEPAWLPDSSGFVYASNAPGRWSLVRAMSNAPSAAISVLVSGETAPLASRPSVSPDGQRVAFCTRIRNVWTVAVAGIDGSRFTLLGEGMMPSWSPDGKRLVFVRTVSGYNHLFLVDPDTGTSLVQLTTGESHDEWPGWSPDSRYLIFATNRGWNTYPGATAYTRNLYAIKPDGSGLTQLTAGNGESSGPAWGKDGWIYFASDQIGNFDIWRFKVVGELARPQ